jgi:hypothetical protein
MTIELAELAKVDDVAEAHREPQFSVNVEGTLHPWPTRTITTEQIAALGGWESSIGVIEIDRENNERTLAPGEIVELKPGHGFAKRIRFKRG